MDKYDLDAVCNMLRLCDNRVESVTSYVNDVLLMLDRMSKEIRTAHLCVSDYCAQLNES